MPSTIKLRGFPTIPNYDTIEAEQDVIFGRAIRITVDRLRNIMEIQTSSELQCLFTGPATAGYPLCAVLIRPLASLLQEMIRQAELCPTIACTRTFHHVPQDSSVGAWYHVTLDCTSVSSFCVSIQRVTAEDIVIGLRQRQCIAAGKISQLSAREHEVLTMVANGLSNKSAAIRLHLSSKTIEKHRASIMRKLGARSVTDLLQLWFSMNWDAVLNSL